MRWCQVFLRSPMFLRNPDFLASPRELQRSLHWRSRPFCAHSDGVSLPDCAR